MACAGRQPAGRLRGALAPAARPELLHDRVGRTRVERRSGARAAGRRPGAPPLPLRGVLPRASRAGGCRRAARHPARRGRRRGGADRGRATQGLRAERARDHSDDLDDRVAPAASGGDGVRDRPGDPTRRDEPVAAGCDRPLLVRRRFAQSRDRPGGAQYDGSDRIPGTPVAASLRVRGQRARASASRHPQAGSSRRSPLAPRFDTRSPTGTIRRRCSPSRGSWLDGFASDGDPRCSTFALSAT